MLFWRSAFGSGIVAQGVIVDHVPIETHTSALRHVLDHDDSPPEYSHICAAIAHHTFNLSNPLSAGYLRAGGLNTVVTQSKKLPRHTSGRLNALQLSLTAEESDRLRNLATSAPSADKWPTAWDLVPGDEIGRRKQVHDVFGGSRQRVAVSGQTPNILVFNPSQAESKLNGLGWRGEHLLIAGNAESGRRLTHHNLAMLGHVNRGMALRVFNVEGDRCRYLGEFTVAPHDPVDHWENTGQRARWTPNRISKMTGPPPDTKMVPVIRLRPLDRGRALSADQPATSTRRVHLSLRHTVTDTNQAATKAENMAGGSHDNAVMLRTLRTLAEQDPSAIAQLGILDDARIVSALIAHAQRRSDLDKLRSIVETPANPEHKIQEQLQGMPWVFGGEFIHETARRTLTATDQLDMSLIRFDGSLHGVELKRAHIEELVTGKPKRLVVGGQVNRAVGQAMNYLRVLDENRDHILNELDLDCRRASITVVIGHTSFVSANYDRRDILEAIRTYNSHLTRITVVTYDALIESAERALLTVSPPTDHRENRHSALPPR
ncbi:Shedu anti-phage system protein SduA domain-containing protein [Mycobacterium sp. DBP42]|uniref:Shedu anti-phage system protein SduA domain-containing protein n=1 Tax=Mycobacterium sp. DBP42 TaxID=2545267 RepID=UPI000871B599|nr:Shedu anti-phage system protein SduA domain-containing protein [Mycobacterium sp. DBP42]TMS50373.1 DUF4263 domain-containing protein [Mycobacterium sp. DBP42]